MNNSRMCSGIESVLVFVVFYYGIAFYTYGMCLLHTIVATIHVLCQYTSLTMSWQTARSQCGMPATLIAAATLSDFAACEQVLWQSCCCWATVWCAFRGHSGTSLTQRLACSCGSTGGRPSSLIESCRPVHGMCFAARPCSACNGVQLICSTTLSGAVLHRMGGHAGRLQWFSCHACLECVLVGPDALIQRHGDTADMSCRCLCLKHQRRLASTTCYVRAAERRSSARPVCAIDSTLDALLSPTSVLSLCSLGKAAERLRAARVEMHVVATVVEATAAPMSTRDPLRPLMDKIYRQVRNSAIASACQPCLRPCVLCQALLQ